MSIILLGGLGKGKWATGLVVVGYGLFYVLGWTVRNNKARVRLV